MLRDAQSFGNRARTLSASRDNKYEAAALLAWYDRARRDLPWRARPGEVADPYRVWISEIMLQQTTVAAVAPYFHAFVGRWPRIEDLAAAELDQVLHAWQGLGYYARARHLHACAQTVVARHAGVLPSEEAALRLLPGVGDYTAAAIAAIAFDRPATAVDGNVLRVVARLHAVEEALPAARPRLVALAQALTPCRRPGDFAQAMMDLGATVCTPRRPRCPACPWQGRCAAYQTRQPEDYPRRAAKAAKPVRRGVVFWLQRADGAVLVRRRPSRGLLGGMMEFPSTPWRAAPWTVGEAVAVAPAGAAPGGSGWAMLPGTLRHTFTHFHLDLDVLVGRDPAPVGDEAPDGRWCTPADFAGLALPTLMKKVVRLVATAGERLGLPF
jgi:A/G-specific adenine glycosylase